MNSTANERTVDEHDVDPVAAALSLLLDAHRDDTSGALADYIPELATVDPDGFGIALTSVHGRTAHAGDARTPFTIQSVSKPFVYALAACELGIDEVARHVGFEPSGEPFNAISLDAATGRPANPLINAGAIVTSALVGGGDAEERFDRVRAFLSACAGRDLDVDEAVYASEDATGDRNRALAHLARSAGVLRQPVDDATEVYFRQCSLVVTTEDLSVMAATLANGGVNPVTEATVMSERVATVTLAIMTTCGMYDHSGAWMARVGLPAKSGVGGGIVAVNPSQFGIGVYSPRLDEYGNSIRGSDVLQSLSERFELHVFDHPDRPRSPIVRADDHTGEHGDELTLVVRGELDLISAEEVVAFLREWAATRTAGTIHVDASGVSRVREVARRLLTATIERLRATGFAVTIDGTV
jgi:glutaminase